MFHIIMQPKLQGNVYTHVHCTRTSKKNDSNKHKNQLQKIEKKVGMKYKKSIQTSKNVDNCGQRMYSEPCLEL